MRFKVGNQFDTGASRSAPSEPRDGDRAPDASDAPKTQGLASRRAVMREGAKLAFVAPLLSTFLASQAYAANVSCYYPGVACNAQSNKPCCNGACSGDPGVCP